METKVQMLQRQLIELSELEDSFFKSRAYKNASLALNDITDEEFDKRDTFIDIPGIGYSIDAKIEEFKYNGIISKLQTLRSESSEYLDPYYYKVRKGFITKKITYSEARIYLTKISRVVFCPYTIAGSYRRGKLMIGDLDIIVTKDKYDTVVADLSREYKVLSSGSYKSSFLIDSVNNIQLDVIGVTEEERSFQLLYLTGSKEFNIRMRSYAKKQGYLLNQTGLYDSDYNLVPSNSLCGTYEIEKDIFDKLEMEYVEPKNR